MAVIKNPPGFLQSNGNLQKNYTQIGINCSYSKDNGGFYVSFCFLFSVLFATHSQHSTRVNAMINMVNFINAEINLYTKMRNFHRKQQMDWWKEHIYWFCCEVSLRDIKAFEDTCENALCMLSNYYCYKIIINKLTTMAVAVRRHHSSNPLWSKNKSKQYISVAPYTECSLSIKPYVWFDSTCQPDQWLRYRLLSMLDIVILEKFSKKKSIRVEAQCCKCTGPISSKWPKKKKPAHKPQKSNKN